MTMPAATISAIPTTLGASSRSPQSSQAQNDADIRKKYSNTARKLVSPDW